MRRPLGEGAVELAALSWLDELGYRVVDGDEIAPDSESGERTSYHDVILSGRLRAALARLNPALPQAAIEEIVRRIERSDTPSLVEENRRLHRMFAEGVDVQVPRDEGGDLRTVKAWLVDCEEPQRNDWLVVRQFKVIENKYNRRADLVVFVNGLPLAVVELKNPGGPNASLEGAFNQLQTYKTEIPSLFRTNAFLVISDGIQAKVGSLTADVERFMPWRTTDGYDLAPKGTPELPVLLKGVLEKRRLLELVRGYTVFVERDGELIKIIAGYHQFHAVRHAVERTLAAAAPEGSRRIGVIWHTQGSGKSLLMVFYAGRIIVEPAMTNPTILVVTDRNDLDDQLLSTFAMCRDLIRQTPVQAENRGHLRELLAVPSGGVVFTTIQKFVPDDSEESYPLLTKRRNVVVIADEAHRSQYGLGARIRRDSGQVAYGFAKYLRDALPNASFIGFTGTPIESDDRSTPAIFGEYIDIYDIHRAVEDGSTVPIYYESRLAKIELDEKERPMLDAEIEDLAEGDEPEEQEKLKQKWSRIEALVGAEKRLHLIAQDLVSHFERPAGRP